MNTATANFGYSGFSGSIHAGMACLRKLLNSARVARRMPESTPMTASRIREITIDDLGFTPKVIQALEREDILTLEDLVRKTPSQLLKLRGFGVKTLEKINAALALRGACLRSDNA